MKCPHKADPRYCTDSVCESARRFKEYAEHAGLTPRELAGLMNRMTPEQIKELRKRRTEKRE